MNFLITGVCGFIGSHVAQDLVLQGHSVVGVDKLFSRLGKERLASIYENENFSFANVDLIRDVSGLCERVDIVVHLAAKTYVDHSILDSDPFVQDNIVATHNLLKDAVNSKRVQRVVAISTDEIYGPCKGEPFKEDSPARPSNPYSATKAAAEMLLLSFYTTYNLPINIIRASNVFGVGQSPQKVIPTFVRHGLQQQPLPVYGDGMHSRIWINVRDFSKALERIVEKAPIGEIYNVAGQSEITNLDLARKVLDILGNPRDQLHFIPDKDARPGHDRRYAMNCDKIRSLGWEPKISLDDSIDETVQWYKNRSWWGNSF